MRLNLPRTLYLVALAHLALELCANFLPILYPTWITTMGLTYAQVGLIALVASTFGSLAQPLFGYASDRWNNRWLSVLSVSWLGLFMGLVGFAPNYLSLLLLVGMASIGSAAFHPAGAIITTASSQSRRGTALSIFSVGGNLGSAISPILITAGFAWIGLSATVIFIPIALLASLLLYLHFTLNSEAESSSHHSSETHHGHHHQVGILNGGSLISLSIIVAAVMCRSWFQVSLTTYLPEWIQNQGWSLSVAGQVLSVYLVFISVGSLAGGYLSDRVGRWQIFAVSLALMALAQWLFLVTSGFVQIMAVAAIGMMIGLSFPVAIVMAQEAWPRGVGFASAMVMGLGWLPGGIGASVTGFIADGSSLAVGLQSLVLLPLVGLICMIIFAVRDHRQADQTVWSELH